MRNFQVIDPWGERLMPVTLWPSTLAEIFRHAEASYPNECCGFIRRSGALHRADNHQDALHEADPDRHPRTARKAYSLAPRDLLALSRSFDEADPGVVLYHSHPDASAYFSRKDEEDALLGDRLKYPVAFLVVEVRAGKAIKANLFHFAGSTFHCVWSSDSIEQEGVHADV